MRTIGRGEDRPSRLEVAFPVPVLFLSLGACASSDAPAVPRTLDQAVEWVDTLRLQETGSALVAVPELREDPAGGWLYWDTRLDEARRYERDGRLAAVIGRKGSGPGEFNRIRALVRLADGRLATLDGRGRLATWSDSGELQRDIATGLSARGVAALPDGRLAVVLPPRQDGGEVLGMVVHALNVDRGSIEGTLFTAAIAPEYVAAAGSVQPPLPRVYDDRLHVTLLDSAWVVSSGTEETRAYSLRSTTEDWIVPPSAGSPARPEMREWLARTVFIGEFARLSDRSWIIGTYRVRDNRIRHGLRWLDADGDVIWDIRDSPRFLEADSEDLLYFADPDGLDPAMIIVGRLRS